MKVEEIVEWREALVQLTDQHFFDLLRMYIGAIKTPFNKQRLVEDLSSFLRKEENRNKIISCLDSLDYMVLSAINVLTMPTQQKICALLSADFSFAEVYDRILNLEERLLIYRKDERSHKTYAFNPYFSSVLSTMTGLEYLVQSETTAKALAVPLPLDDLTLASLYAFFLHEHESVKSDGNFKKKTLCALESIFPRITANPDLLRLLISSFLNLGLFIRTDGRIIPDTARWSSFATQTFVERMAYLAASASGRYPRELLQKKAHSVLVFLSSLQPGALYRRSSLERLALVLSDSQDPISPVRLNTRFSKIIQTRGDTEREQETAQGMDIVSITAAFGLLVCEGPLFSLNSLFFEDRVFDAKPYLIVSPSFSVTLMPGFSLQELLPLLRCLEVTDIQLAGQFELTRRSCTTAFDLGLQASDILTSFQEKSEQPLPGNITFTLEDWYRSWTSISLYHGYVLQIDDTRRVLFENNELLRALIRKKLADGVYVLNADSYEAINDAFIAAGLDSAPALGSFATPASCIPLPSITSFTGIPLRLSATEERAKAYDTIKESLLTALDKQDLPQDMHDALLARIERRVALFPFQLDSSSVRIEKMEARGMDFLGKVRIAEYALAALSYLEVLLDEKDGGLLILGRPTALEKKTGDVLLKITSEPDMKQHSISIGRCQMVRRIRGSIFSDLTQ